MDRREQELLERGVIALEKLADEPIVRTEGGPPICPHCNSLNPRVRIARMDESVGPFIEYYVPMRCENCTSTFYAVPLEWATFTDPVEVREELQNRRSVLDNGNGGN